MPIQSLEELEELVAHAGHASVAVDMMNQAAYDIRYLNPALTHAVARRAIQRAAQAQYTKGQADASRILGIASALLNDYPAALENMLTALEFYDQADDHEGSVQTTAGLAGVYQLMGDYATALDMHNRVLASERRRGNPEMRSNTLYNMGLIYEQMMQYEKALNVHREAHSIRLVLNDQAGITLSLSCIGECLRALGRYDEAEHYLQDSLRNARALDQDFLVGQPLLYLGHLYLSTGRLAEAEEILELAANQHTGTDNLPHLADVYLMQARVAWARREPPQAHLKLEASLALSRQLGIKVLEQDALALQAEIHAQSAPFPHTVADIDREPKKIASLPRQNEATETHSHTPSAPAAAAPKPPAPEIVPPPRGQDHPRFVRDAIPTFTPLDPQALSPNRLARLTDFTAAYEMDPKLSVDLLNATWRLRLPTVEQLRRLLPESFVYHLPLPGPCTDFYIQAERGDVLYLGIANSPGEGIEISLYTQLAYEYLATLMYHPAFDSPADILNAFQDYIRPALDHPNWIDKPEMRLAVVKVDQRHNTITFSGAGLSIFWKGNQSWEELSIGHLPLRGGEPSLSFEDNELNGQKGNQLYLATDGYQRLAELADLPPLLEQLKEIQGYDFSLKAPVLKSIIEKALKKTEAPDDILILGAGL
jgi:tetratricopeptide (TPR) repeat protein